MARVSLQRFEGSEEGTFGIFRVEVGTTEYSFFSGELSWKDNQPNVSCIPTGVYVGRYCWSPRLKRSAYLIDGVPNRAGIRIHPANFMGASALGLLCQLNGCIALGEKLGWIEGQRSLLLSRPAVRRFEELLKQQDFELEIKNG